MKKTIKYIFIFFLFVYIIPVFLTKKKPQNNNNEAKTENVQTQDVTIDENTSFNYKDFATIKLYHKKNDEIEELPLDKYLFGVVSAEIPANYNIEALKAQAIAARTYTIYQIKNSKGKHDNADICDDYACCQAWISKEDRMERWNENEKEENWEKIKKAVTETAGLIVTYNGNPIDAFFHSNSGGTTEMASNVWGGENYPYLQSVETSGENEYSEYSSEVEISKTELIKKLKEKHPEVNINFNEKDSIKITEYTESGRVRNIKFGNVELSGTETRSLLGLKSTNFSVEIGNEKINFHVLGYGHGVGLSQTGADSLAKQGYNYEQILKHYYSGVEITNI